MNQELADHNQEELNAKRLTTQLASLQKSQQESYQKSLDYHAPLEEDT